jgi:threonine dehydrogenase-like Zn-dependent dehydrogenase
MIGAAPIIAVDPLAAARDRAREFGADFAFDPADSHFGDQVGAVTGGAGLDVAYDMAGVPAVREQAMRCLGRDGRLVLVGLTPEPLTVPNSITLSVRGTKILGHYGSQPGDVERLVELIRYGRLDLSRSVSGTVPLSEAPAAVKAPTNKQGNPIRLILEP